MTSATDTLKHYNAKLSYSEKSGTWCLSDADAQGNYWETDDYEAENEADVLADAAQYLEDYNN